MSFEFNDNAVCFAIGWQWFYDKAKLNLNNLNGSTKSFDALLEYKDFQLNEIRIGDYIEKSELGTEQKYSDVVEVFELFGFEPYLNHDLNKITFCKTGSRERTGLVIVKSNVELDYDAVDFRGVRERKLTHNQIMSIGKLKRLMNEREDEERTIKGAIDNLACGENGKEILKQTDALDIKRQSEYCGCLKVDLNDVTTLNPCAGGFSVGYKCEKSAPKSAPKTTPEVSTDNKSDIQKVIDKTRAELSADKKHKPIVAQVMIDLTERMEAGIKEYGEALRPNNGRDALQDAYEEALDLACYLKQAIIERDSK